MMASITSVSFSRHDPWGSNARLGNVIQQHITAPVGVIKDRRGRP